jgi:basic membrane protein A
LRNLMKHILLVGCLLFLVIVLGFQGQALLAANNKLKVAFVYQGAVGDMGWDYAHDQGRKYLEKTLPNVTTTFVESIPETADCERILTELAEKGNKVIFTTSYGYMDYVCKVAAKYPNVVFLHCGGYKTAKNVGTYFGRDYEGRYLSGLAAGKYTKSNILGFVAAFPIPKVVRMINAFELGAQAVNPKAKVKVVWTNTWYDPAIEKDAAKSLINVGADVLTMEVSSPACMQAAQDSGIYGLSFNSDMRFFAPKAILTGGVWNWGPYYVKTVKDVMKGKWKSEQYWGGISDGIIDIGPYGPMVTDDVKQLIAQKRKILMKDDWAVFAGPIKDQSGQIRVKAGQKMTDQKMFEFNWFVQGVEGTIPK